MRKGMISVWMVQFIVRIFFLVIVFFSFVFLVGNFVQVNVDTLDTEARVVAHRIIHTGLAYRDETIGRTYPYTIDASKGADKIEDDLKKFLEYKRKIAASYRIFEMGEEGIHPDIYSISGYYDKELFSFLKPLEGSGAVRSTESSYPIRIRKEDGSFRPGLIIMEVLQAE